MNKILCIIGPTATGKTALSTKLSSLFPSVLISADSRQVYRGMDIVTGKDHPQTKKLYGIDLVYPNEDFSVSNWFQAIEPLIIAAHQKGQLPIIVGGTGLYLRHLYSPIATINIPHDQGLRQILGSLSVSELTNKLKALDPQKLSSMNNSDRQNPRRLIRAIEVATHPSITSQPSPSYDIKTIALKHPDAQVYKKQIKRRVISRIDQGAIAETITLLNTYNKTLPALTAIGYRSIISFLDGQISEEMMITKWIQDELAYSKRQILYMDKMLPLNWYDPLETKLVSKLENEIKSWYDNGKITKGDNL